MVTVTWRQELSIQGEMAAEGQEEEQLELMSQALAALRREHLPSQPRTFATLAEGPLEEMR